MKYILISLGVLLLIIFGIVIFNQGGSPRVETPAKQAVKLTDFSTKDNASVEFTTEGAIIAPENHRTILINISPLTRTVTVFTGYEGQVFKTQTLPNDKNSYTEFLAALARAGFVKERKIDGSISSQAICPTGTRTHYKVIEGGNDVQNLWSASCTTGSFGGNTPLTGTLFRAQIPNYSSITQGVSFGASGSGSSSGIF